MSQKTNISNIDDVVFEYYEHQKSFKANEAEFDKAKKQFYQEMETFFRSGHEPIDKLVVNSAMFADALVITRIQKVSLKFDTEKLETALGKDQASSVIAKKYEIINMPGLIKYLKQFGVNPSDFKAFINVTKEVNQEALNQMEELGKVKVEDLEGTFTANKQNPYFVVNKLGGKKGGNA